MMTNGDIIYNGYFVLSFYFSVSLSHSYYFPYNKKFGRARDPVKFLQAVEQRARERQVAYETVRILRSRVIECYRREGVNHYDNCKKPVQDFYNIIKKRDYGQLHPDWENPVMKDGFHGTVAPLYDKEYKP
jgi:NADH-ubiquinone oxidoreductase subunit 10